MEQSLVGKVLSSCAITPPMLGFFSIRETSIPISAKSSAAWIPAIPPPITATLGSTLSTSQGFRKECHHIPNIYLTGRILIPQSTPKMYVALGTRRQKDPCTC